MQARTRWTMSEGSGKDLFEANGLTAVWSYGTPGRSYISARAYDSDL